MAKPHALQSRQQHIGETNLRAGNNTAFQKKAENLSALNSAFTEITDPIVESVLGGEAESARLAKFEREKNLPIEQIPKDESGFNPISLTKYGKWYDKSYNELDKQLIGYQANNAFKELALDASNPANQGAGMTERYEEGASQIVEAYSGASTPANRNTVNLALMNTAQDYRFKIAQTEQRKVFENTKSSLDAVLKEDLAALEDAALVGKADDAVILQQKIDNNITSQQNLGILTPAEADAQRKSIARVSRQSFHTGEVIKGIERGEGEKVLHDFITNPPEDLTVSEVYETAGQMGKVLNANKAAVKQYEALQDAQLNQDIITGKVTEPWQIANYELSGIAQIEGTTKIIRAQQENKKAYAQIELAQDAIRNGESSGLNKATISKLYDGAQEVNRQALEAVGSRLTPIQRSESILGIGAVYPVSGIQGQSLGTNVPEFDNLVGGMLTSGNLEQMIQGAQIYNQHVNVAKQPNTLSLDADEVLIASAISASVRSNGDPLAAAEQARKTILDKNNPINEYKASEFNSDNFQKKLPTDFKTIFGEGLTQFENDEAFATFKTLYRQNYIAGTSKESALEATKYQMQYWGRSDYFPDGKVLPMPPERTNIYKAGFSFNNQQIYRLQEIINSNPDYKWAGDNQVIDLNSLTDEQKVLIPLGKSQEGSVLKSIGDFIWRGAEQGTTLADIQDVKSSHPRIKVQDANGEFETEVYLYPDASVNYASNGNPRYAMVYKDRFGNIQPMMDETGINPAYFNPAPLSVWAPDIGTDEHRAALKAIASEIYHRPIKEVGQTFGGIFNPLFLPKLRNAKERMGNKSEEEIFNELLNKPGISP